jgi:hypothetical protein
VRAVFHRIWSRYASVTLRFFILGAALLAARATLARLMPRERPVVEVLLPEGLEEAAVRRRVDEAIMVEEGLRFGWAATDPIIRRRLAMNMTFAAGAPLPTSDATIPQQTIEQAIALGMDRSDPVVRRRLIDRVERVLDTPGPDEQPDDEALAAHLEANRERFARPGRISLVQVLLRRDRHDALEADAAALLERLQREGVSPERGPSLGDPMPLLASRQQASVVGLDRTFGSGFGEAAEAAPLGEWSGPFASAYGLHLVFVEAREAGRLPPLDAIRARVLADYQSEHRHARLARRLAALRELYEVRIVRPEGAS